MRIKFSKIRGQFASSLTLRLKFEKYNSNLKPFEMNFSNFIAWINLKTFDFDSHSRQELNMELLIKKVWIIDVY